MEKKDDLKDVKSLLSKLDSKVLMIALTELEMDRKEITEIKEFLKNKNPHSIQTAFYELNYTVEKSEVDKTIEKIRSIDKKTLRTVLTELGITERLGLCFESVKCYGRAIWFMRCTSSLYAFVNPIDEVINPSIRTDINPIGGGVIIDG